MAPATTGRERATSRRPEQFPGMTSAGLASRLAAGTLLAAVLVLAPPETGARSAEPGQLGQGHGAPLPAELDLAGLTEGVRDTRAISLIAKLEIKQKAERLIDDMQLFHDGRGRHELTSLRERFDDLLSWLVSLVSPADPQLHDQLVASRDALWYSLADPVNFRKPTHLSGRGGKDQGH